MCIALGVTILSGCGVTMPDEPSASLTARPADSTSPTSPSPSLGSVPGFGTSDEEVLRDDTLAYWEAYGRDTVVQECMARAGFDWEVEVLYPESATRGIADSLGVAPASPNSMTPLEANLQYASSLNGAEADRYYRALYGVDAESFAEALEEQGDPSELDEGETSCTRKGADHGARVWELRDHLEPAIRAARVEYRDSADGVSWTSRAYQCAEDQGLPDIVGEEAVDSALKAGADPAAVQRVEQECGPIWKERLAAESEYASRVLWDSHQEELEEQRRKYARAMEELRANSGFLAHLSEVIP